MTATMRGRSAVVLGDDALAGLDAVHHRHVDVHQHDSGRCSAAAATAAAPSATTTGSMPSRRSMWVTTVWFTGSSSASSTESSGTSRGVRGLGAVSSDGSACGKGEPHGEGRSLALDGGHLDDAAHLLHQRAG